MPNTTVLAFCRENLSNKINELLWRLIPYKIPLSEVSSEDIKGKDEATALEKKAAKNIEFKGSLEWKEIEKVFSKTKALLFPGEEDFGMIPLEVMAYGIPVIAYKKGGALETIIENKQNVNESSGLFFDGQDSRSIQYAVESFERIEQKFDPKWISDHAEKFKEKQFLLTFTRQVEFFLKEVVRLPRPF